MIHRDLTTGEAARLSHVSIATIRECCDSGLLRSYRVPGGKKRRIPQKWLREFLVRHDMAVPRELETQSTGVQPCSAH